MFFNKKKNFVKEQFIIYPEYLTGELDIFKDVTCLQWLFNYEDDDFKIYVYKIKNQPYLYARINITPSGQFSVRLFTYMGFKVLDKNNLFNVKIGDTQLNYVITNAEMKVFSSNYDLLFNKLIDQYWECVDKNIGISK